MAGKHDMESGAREQRDGEEHLGENRKQTKARPFRTAVLRHPAPKEHRAGKVKKWEDLSSLHMRTESFFPALNSKGITPLD